MDNSNTLKIAYLLAQYLYTHKRLDLPGIGTFKLDPSVNIDTDNNKQRSALSDGVSFENNSSLPEPMDLVNYISSKAGKMKALAIADLECHLELAHQFLNIGKPFAFEGIGSLVKLKKGEFAFTPGSVISERAKEPAEKDVHGITKKDNVDAKYQAFLSTPVIKTPWKKPVVALLVLCGIALAIWAGYSISGQDDENNDATLTAATVDATVPVVDSSMIKKADSIAAIPTTYKYVLEIAKAQRAFKRLEVLKDNGWDAKMETKDSVQYKLFLILPVTTDTTWKKDSLTALGGRKVYIEH